MRRTLREHYGDLYTAILREYYEAFDTKRALNAGVIASFNELAFAKLNLSNMFDAPPIEPAVDAEPAPVYLEVGDEVDF